MNERFDVAQRGEPVEPRRARVLLAEDETALQELFTDYLELAGFEVRTEKDGLAALEGVHAWNPDVLVLDIKMPKLDGWEVCRRLKGNPATEKLPIILLTAFDQTTDHEKAAALSVQDYVAKPCQPSDLVHRIRRRLASAPAAR